MLYRSIVDFSILNHRNNCSEFTFFLQKNRKYLHPPGFQGCFLSRKHKLILMHIDKCASSSISIFCEQSDYFHDMSFRLWDITLLNKFVKNKDYFFLSIIRNPVDRYISGLQEVIKRYNLSDEFIEENLKNDKFIFDEHTSPQYIFLRHCHHNLKSIKLDKHLSKKLSSILGYNVDLPNLNNSDNKLKIKCTHLCEKYLKDNEKFYDVYKKDFELFEKAD